MTSGGVTIKWPNFEDIQRVPREDGGVDIMLDGKIIDTIEPIKHRPTQKENEAFLRHHRERVRRIAEQIGDGPADAVELVREERRDFSSNDPSISSERRQS